MSKTLDSKNFGDKLYNSLPEMYRVDDANENFALKRYLQSLADGGFEKVIEETNGLMTLVDPDKVDKDILPVLFKSYGFEVFNGIPELYLRKLLPMVSKLFALKGSITSVEYLTSLVSGVKSTVEVSDSFNEDHSIDVKLDLDYNLSPSELPDREQLLRIISEFVPFYCSVVIVYSYFFNDDFRAYVQDTYSRDYVTFSSSDSARLKFEESGEKIKMTLTNEDELSPLFIDYNTVLNSIENRLNTSFVLNNMNGVFDTVKRLAGEDNRLHVLDQSSSSVKMSHSDESRFAVEDSHEDAVTMSAEDNHELGILDSGGITNSFNSVLNSTFLLNNMGCYDTIKKIGSEDEIIFN